MIFQKRKQTGSSLAETACISFLVIIIGLLALDIAFFVWGGMLNDAAARDAARAAGQARDAVTAVTRAQQAALAHTTDGYFVSQPTVAANTVVYQLNPTDPNPFGIGVPFAQATSTTNVRLPAPFFFGNTSFADGLYTLRKTYTFPITGRPLTTVAQSTGVTTTTTPTSTSTTSASTSSSTTGSPSTTSSSSTTSSTSASTSTSTTPTSTSSTSSSTTSTTGTGTGTGTTSTSTTPTSTSSTSTSTTPTSTSSTSSSTTGTTATSTGATSSSATSSSSTTGAPSGLPNGEGEGGIF